MEGEVHGDSKEFSAFKFPCTKCHGNSKEGNQDRLQD